MEIGEKIRELRKERELTQNELAKDLMLTQDTVSRIEKGNREVTNSELVAISKYFNVSTDYLLGITEIKTPDTDIQAICEYTGLSDKAVENLHSTVFETVEHFGKNVLYPGIEFLLYLLSDEVYCDFLEILDCSANSFFDYNYAYAILLGIDNSLSAEEIDKRLYKVNEWIEKSELNSYNVVKKYISIIEKHNNDIYLEVKKLSQICNGILEEKLNEESEEEKEERFRKRREEVSKIYNWDGADNGNNTETE